MSATSGGIHVPIVDHLRCTNCGLCITACPGGALKFDADALVGNHLNCYMGCCTDERMRWEASSGGLVTGLLLFMLDRGIIDGALVTRANENSPLEPEPFIARTKKEVLAAMGSKYCPVPIDIKLKDLLRLKERFAVVGLPCHIEAIRNAEKRDKELGRKLVLHLGLFCAQTPNILGTKYLLSKYGVKASDVAQITYRGDGWPGYGSLTLRTGEVKRFRFLEWQRTGLLPFFKPIRCMLCYDITNRLADVSFGDAWRLSGDRSGMSLVISRSQIGEKVLRDAQLEGRVALRPVSRADVVTSQGLSNRMKKFVARSHVWNRQFRRDVPVQLIELPRPSLLDLLNAMFYCSVIWMSQKDFFQSLVLRAGSLSGAASILIPSRDKMK